MHDPVNERLGRTRHVPYPGVYQGAGAAWRGPPSAPVEEARAVVTGYGCVSKRDLEWAVEGSPDLAFTDTNVQLCQKGIGSMTYNLRHTTLKVAAAAIALSIGSLTASAEQTLRVATEGGLKATDPFWTTAYITRNHGYMVYDTLFALDEAFEVQPQMVDTWTVSEDSRVYTFTLREGLTWHDGDPVTAEDCVASIKLWGQRDSLGQRLAQAIKSFDVVDERTFSLTLKRPTTLVLESLAKLSSNVPFMLKAEHARKNASSALDEVVGSGPFRFVARKWKPGEKTVYARNEAYVPRDEPASGAAGGKVAKVDRVEWIRYSKANRARKALLAGKVDIWEAPPPAELRRLQGRDDIVVQALDRVGKQGWIRMNHLRAPFSDPKVRLAFLYAVDQEEYLRAITASKDHYEACPGFFTCKGANATLAGSEPLATVDLEKAKALLAESGYAGEKVVLMKPKGFHSLAAAADVTAETLQRIGMNVDVQEVKWGTLAERRAIKGKAGRKGWHLFPTYFEALDAASPLTNIGVKSGDGAWFGWPKDPMVSAMIESYEWQADPAKRQASLVALHERLFEGIPYVNLGQWFNPTAWRKEVSGLVESPVPFYWNITKE